MGFYIILILFLGIAFFWLILNNPAHKSAAFLINAGPFILIAAGGLLTLFRRGMIGMPLIFIGLSWWRHNHANRPITHAGGRKSTVRSESLEMELDHDTGEIDGIVLTGRLKGARLSSLNEEEILSLYKDFYSDANSVPLLESYLDRYHPGWRDNVCHDSYREQNRTPGFKNMSKDEAFQILGVEPNASQEEIHQAWRRLIKGVHPDHGGSAFLTAKINAARDVLLD